MLETLAKSSLYCFVSTKIAQFSPDMHTYFEHLPIVYLLYAGEANNDLSNYWVFTDAGFRRLLERTGWEILDYMCYGNLTRSDPASPSGDERTICLEPVMNLPTGADFMRTDAQSALQHGASWIGHCNAGSKHALVKNRLFER